MKILQLFWKGCQHHVDRPHHNVDMGYSISEFVRAEYPDFDGTVEVCFHLSTNHSLWQPE